MADRAPSHESFGAIAPTRQRQFTGVEGRFAGEQFVEQHSQAVNVAAGIDVQAAHLRLLRTHVGGRADELLELR